MNLRILFCSIGLKIILVLVMNTSALYLKKEVSIVALGISEIINGLNPKSLLILCPDMSKNQDVDDLIYQIHKMNYQSSIFFNVTKYFLFIESTIASSVESTSLIFMNPHGFVELLHENNLAHRLSLYVFYWGSKSPPRAKLARFEEPLRVVIITRPREKAFRVFYNQAIPIGISNLRLVNWYDGDSLGLIKTPLLPSTSSVYSKFDGRIFRIPVIHAPPWFFIDYNTNDSYSNDSIEENGKLCNNQDPEVVSDSKVCVIGGRDHNLLLNLARKMNFKIQYIDPPERAQGSPISAEETDRSFIFSGGIGILQNRSGDILLGDISLNWERGKAVEFSFFTLADSVAFATHAPRRLNEALAVIRPFKLDVWPYLILTILISGPVFYYIIKIPYWWKFNKQCFGKRQNKNKKFIIYCDYINEITYGRRSIKAVKVTNEEQELSVKNLLGHCIWFTLQLFLKQSCSEPHKSKRAKFLTIVYWFAVTYVLADVYSAQLTSQFARPAREAPINTLEKLEKAMILEEYQLYVEKESSALQLLENGTELFQRLYKLMKRQSVSKANKGFLIDSIEKGIEKLVDGSEKIILGGRETLFFNIKRHGLKKFQLSQKLFTRYSAAAVQNGCPFLDSINDVLIHLFEGGILDKLTDIEYEAMSKLLSKNKSIDEIAEDNKNEKQVKSDEDDIIQPLNLRMLQGAFIVLILGHFLACVLLCLEIISNTKKFKKILRRWIKIYRRLNNKLTKNYIYLMKKFKTKLMALIQDFW